MLDANLLLRPASAGNLTGNETGSAIDFGAGDVKPMNYLLRAPAINNPSDTLVVNIQDSDDGSTGWHTFCTLPPVTGTAPAFKTRSVRSAKRYRRFVATVTGGSPNFGAVELGCDPSGQFWGV